MKNFTTYISTKELSSQLSSPQLIVIDCRFDLSNPNWGIQEYQHDHILGAIYAHLDEDLSSPVLPGITGRHPLPRVDQLAEKFGSWGISEGIQVVAYDGWPAEGGAIAARLWWLLRWLGHEKVAVLSGGWRSWVKAGFTRRGGIEELVSRKFIPSLQPGWIVSSEQVDVIRQDVRYRLFDSRASDRFRGENETIDPIAGHIPGAISAPFDQNYDQAGEALPSEVIRKRFNQLLGDVPAKNAVFYCGSGVTATMNLLAYEHAGFGNGRLYAGSWSEWINDPKRPIAIGNE